MDYLESLNEVQRKAVEHSEGPVMVIAGAGSGKTRVLTYRIGHLINKGVSPFNILSLTFTNKAAKEMKLRIADMVGEAAAKTLWMGTFHSIFAKILRIEAQLIGYPSNFTIYDTDDSRRVIKDILKELKLDDKVYKPNLVQHRISSAKNNLLSPKAYAKNIQLSKEDAQSQKPLIAKIYEMYDKRLFKAGAMDFDDLLFKTNILLRDHPAVLHKYQDKFRYILVDEYQDTNFSQYVIVRALAARFQNITVVGDDSQSIYAFRGANIQNILNFKKDYPETVDFKLEQNYRSTANIVKAANSVIEKNSERLPKDVWTSNDEGNKIKVQKLITDNEEGAHVANQILSVRHAEQAPYSSFAILYRTNAQSRAMEDALRKQNIPYRIYGGLSFYQRKEIKDILAYLRLVVNDQDEEALKRVINYPTRGIGNTTQNKLNLYAAERELNLNEVLRDLDLHPIQLGGAIKNKIRQFATMIDQFRSLAKKKNAWEVASQIASTTGILKELYVDKTPEGVSRYENVQELLNSMKEFVEDDTVETEKDLATFIQDIPLLTDQDNDKDENRDQVTLMTIHASKGLEFPYVFIVGLEENLFPSQLSINSKTELEEERRLFYVAITRAEKQCHMSFATSRYKWGNLVYSEPSRFIEEIDPEYLDLSGMAAQTFGSSGLDQSGWGSEESFAPKPKSPPRPAAGRKPSPVQGPPRRLIKVPPTSASSSFQGDDTTKLQSGMQVEHARFGTGKVLNIEGSGAQRKATVFFQGIGQKQLLLKFAKLKIIG